MANVTASMENVAKTTLWQSNESSYLNLVEYYAQGAVIRTRRQWHNYGEKQNAKYFFQLEKYNYKKKNRTMLKDVHRTGRS